MESVFTTSELVLFGLINFVVAIFSAISGGGGGFIGTPLLIFFGLTPAQAVATGKLGGLSIAVCSLGAMRDVKKASIRQLLLLIGLAAGIGLLAPLAIVRMDGEVYRRILGVMLLVAIPMMIVKKVGRVEQHVTTAKKVAGWLLIIASLSLQAVFAGGMGTFVTIILMAFLGMPALQANVTRRWSQVVQNVVVVGGLLSTGLIVWRVAAVCIITAGVGGFIGGKIATKKGDEFIMTIFIIMMFISALELLFG